MRPLIAAVALLALAAGPAQAAGRTDDAKKPVVLLLSKDMGSSCTALGRYVARLPTTTIATPGGPQKFTGDIKTLGMRGVGSCDDSVYATSDASLWNEAYTFAKWIERTYAGKPVDVVAAGVSGLVVRYALAQSQRRREGLGGDASVYPDLAIEDVVTLGTPHWPTTAMDGACPECEDLHPTDHELWDVLATPQGLNPQGVGGTDWSLLASNGDRSVPVSSALAMRAGHQTVYLKPAFDHSGYLNDIDTASDASIQYRHATAATDELIQWNRAPHTYWRVAKELVFGDSAQDATAAGGPDCTGYNEAKGGATVIADPKLAGWAGPSGPLRVVRSGTIEALAQCFKKGADGTYATTGPVRIDGLDLTPTAGKRVVIDPATREVSSESATVSLPRAGGDIDLIKDHALSWSYPRSNGSVSPTDGELIKPSGSVKIGGFSLSGSLGVTVGAGTTITGGYTQVDLAVSAPMFNGQVANGTVGGTDGECKDGIDNDVDAKTDGADPECAGSQFEAGVQAGPGINATIKSTNGAGATIDKLGGKLEGSFAVGTTKFKGAFTFVYTFADDSWRATGSVTLPMASPLTVSGVLGFKAGALNELSLELKGLRIPVGPVPGLFVSRLKGGAIFDPLTVMIGSGFVYGPIPNLSAGLPPFLAEVNGDLTFGRTAAGASTVKLAGDGSFLGNQVASGSLEWTEGQGFKLITSVGRTFTVGDPASATKPSLTTTINAGVNGTLNDQGLDVSGTAQLCLKGSLVFTTIDTTCAVNARVRASKHGDAVALSGCGGVVVLGQSVEIGGAIVWPDGLGGTPTTTAMVDTCDVDRWHAAAATTRAAGGATSFTLPAGLRAELVGIEGQGGAPDVVLAGPGGRQLASVHSDELAQLDGAVAWRVPSQHMTYVLIGKPAGGAWTVTAQAGSAPVAAVRVADTLPEPAVRARVRRAGGGARVVDYDVAPIAGQRVILRERSAGGLDHVIGEARGTAGSLRFRPGFGAGGPRRIVAEVLQHGAPRAEVDAGGYLAPAPPAAGRVRAVRLRRHGGRVTVTWRGAARAVGYDIQARLPDGRLRSHALRATARRIELTGIRGRGATRVSIVALRAHDHRPGPATFVRGGAAPKRRRA